MTPSDFIINHDYKVIEMYDDPTGKWGVYIKDSVFLE